VPCLHAEAAAAGTTRRSRKRSGWRLPTLIALCALGLSLPLWSAQATALGPRLYWLLDLACHWQWLYAQLLLIATLAQLARTQRWRLLFLLPLAALPWWTVAPMAPRAVGNGPSLSVVAANLHHRERDLQPLLGWLVSTRADLVVLTELTPSHARQIEAIAGYPYRQLAPEQGPFGIGLLSRYPLIEAQLRHDADGIPHINALVDFRGQPIRVLGVHPIPPLSPHFHRARDGALRVWAAHAKVLPTVLAGDLNATPWSSGFAGLAEHGLRRASGLAPTWPSAVAAISGLPIDHVLVSKAWSVQAQARGPDIGSDHRPAWVRLQLDHPSPKRALTPSGEPPAQRHRRSRLDSAPSLSCGRPAGNPGCPRCPGTACSRSRAIERSDISQHRNRVASGPRNGCSRMI
jgi:endonuclease/exonuclease/phosphatase (EEP) superfamily protein YafD